jgi:hypothetical protein
MTETASSKSKFFLILLLVSVITVPLALAILYGLGQTSGTEFSPDDFSRRSFKYNQTPYFNWVITKKTYSDTTTPFEETLVLDGLIVPVINRTKIWHLISDSGSTSNFMSAGCDARFLTNFLDLTDDEGENSWMGWNEEYPKSAKIFWPRVADLARHEMYLKIPDVMQFAMEIEKDGVKQFGERLDELIAQAYLELGKIDLELARFERAEIRLQRSVETKSSQEAEELLAVCKTRRVQTEGIE